MDSSELVSQLNVAHKDAQAKGAAVADAKSRLSNAEADYATAMSSVRNLKNKLDEALASQLSDVLVNQVDTSNSSIKTY